MPKTPGARSISSGSLFASVLLLTCLVAGCGEDTRNADTEPAAAPLAAESSAAKSTAQVTHVDKAAFLPVTDGQLEVLSRLGTRLTSLPGEHEELTALVGAASDSIDRHSPLWPISVFMQAEWLRGAGQAADARRLYRSLAEWGVSQPYGDEWGGSSLSVFALWRWVQLMDQDDEMDRSEVDSAMRIDPLLRLDARLTTRVFQFSFLDSLPQIEEDLVRRLALLAETAGLDDRAHSLFLDYLSVRTAPLGAREQSLLDKIVANGWASRERLLAVSALRMDELRRYDEAAEIWRELLQSGDAHDRATAGLRLARYKARRFNRPRAEISEILDGVLLEAKDPALIQEAFYRRALLWYRIGSDRDVERFCTDMTTLLQRYPDGVLADDTLFRLARHAHNSYLAGDASACFGRDPFEEAMERYAALRSYPGDNDWLNSAYYQPAILAYSRGAPGDLDSAAKLLDDLNRLNPDGPLRRHAAFWRARILEDQGDGKAAARAFRSVVEDAPYDYHGLRAQMHLELGPEARSSLWPGPELRNRVAAKFRANPTLTSLPAHSAYHARLGAAIRSGLYRQVVEDRRQLVDRLPKKRLQEIAIDELDADRGAIAVIALLLSLRQDAAAAADKVSTSRNHLEVQSIVAREALDWPVVLALATGEVHHHHGTTDTRANPYYLSSVYFEAFETPFRDVSESRQVPAELLYGLSRRESLFDPAAISAAGALGLFQFIPSTFRALDRQWNLLEDTGSQSREEYLLDPANSADLGGRWLADELIRRQNCQLLKELDRPCTAANLNDASLVLAPSTTWFPDDLTPRQQRVLMLALMEHSAGFRNVRSWLDAWQQQARAEDFEFMLATANAAETRNLVRNVLTDASIAAALGFFAPTDREQQ